MSAQQLTYENVLELIRENSRAMRENSQKNIEEMREERQKSIEEMQEERQKSIEEMRQDHREFRRSLKEQGAEFDRRMKESRTEFNQLMKESNREFNRTLGKITGSIGRVIEHMVAGDRIIKRFQTLGYEINEYSRNKKFGYGKSSDLRGEIDLFLENGDIAILIEVKTTLETHDVRKFMLKLEKFRRVSDMKGDNRRFIGAVAGAVVKGDAEEVAHENGMYVIVQSGKAIDIMSVPEGFKPKEW